MLTWWGCQLGPLGLLCIRAHPSVQSRWEAAEWLQGPTLLRMASTRLSGSAPPGIHPVCRAHSSRGRTGWWSETRPGASNTTPGKGPKGRAPRQCSRAATEWSEWMGGVPCRAQQARGEGCGKPPARMHYHLYPQILLSLSYYPTKSTRGNHCGRGHKKPNAGIGAAFPSAAPPSAA